MAAHGSVGDDAAIEEDGLRHDEIGQVIVTLIGIVLVEHVAGLELGRRNAHETGAERHRHRGEMDRDVAVALHRELAAAGEQTAGEVARLFPQVGIGGAHHDCLHLGNRVDEAGAQHRERDRIELGLAHDSFTSISRLP